MNVFLRRPILHPGTAPSKLLFQEKPYWLIKIRFLDITNMFHKYRSNRPKLFCKNDVFKGTLMQI